MKKLLLVLVLTTSLAVQTKAQQESKFIDASGFTISTLESLQTNYSISKNELLTPVPLPDNDHDFYQRKSRNMRITGLTLLGAGLVLGVSGVLVSSSTSTPNNYDTRDKTITTLFVASAVTGIASIPLMVMASVFKHKANVMVDTKKTGFGVPSNVSKYITGVSLTIPIGK
ncbi:MAG: hypothetical protein IPL84_13070 [Chitinophagaceae bacterium]|nr:hypothetical protein [Chitinophagaceae bacterium]